MALASVVVVVRATSTNRHSSAHRRRGVRTRAGERANESWVDALRAFDPFKTRDERESSSRGLALRERAKWNDALVNGESEQVFGKGPIGAIARAATKVVFRGLSEQFQRASASAEACYEDATRAARVDRALASALGGDVTCGRVMSQSSSSMNVNGKTTTRTTVTFQCRGASGATATVSATNDGVKTRANAILPNGERIDIGSASSAFGDVIDVDPLDVIDA